jgi:Alpha galactosidase C-terminal beta sandwich domain
MPRGTLLSSVATIAPPSVLCACSVVSRRLVADIVSNVAISCAPCVQIFAAPLRHGARAVLFLHRNLTGSAAATSIAWQQLGYVSHVSVTARDLFKRLNLGGKQGELRLSVPPGSVVLVKLQPDSTLACGEAAFVEQDAAGFRMPMLTSKQDVQVVDGVAAGLGQETASGDGSPHSERAGCDGKLELELDAWRPWHSVAMNGDMCRRRHEQHMPLIMMTGDDAD